MDVRVEHCTVCWGYRTHAHRVAEALRKEFGATVEVVDGGLGQFDVFVDGRLVSSRGGSVVARLKPPHLPDLSDIVSAINPQGRNPVPAASPFTGASWTFGPEDAKRFYDHFAVWQDWQFYERPALEYLATHSDFEHASAVFEFGCGSGRLAESLLRHSLADSARYVGIDVSPTMVDIAARRLARWRDRATVQQADGTPSLAQGSHTFDRFLTTYVFDLLPHAAITQVLDEARRLLEPGGRLCVASLTEGVTPLSRMVSSAWTRVHALNPRVVGGCRPLHVSALLDASVWKLEHTHIVCSWGLCSEIVIASDRTTTPS